MPMAMPDLPFLTVVMSVRNGVPYLDPAIHSILAQSHGNFEFLIIDDGSTDDTAAILQRHAKADARIHILPRQDDGFLSNLNHMMRVAQGEWIARMDGDDIALPDRFARQMAHLVRHPDIVALGSTVDFIDVDGRKTGNATLPLDHDSILSTLGTRMAICNPSVIMRRNAVLAVGGYRPPYHHSEDLNLWLRLSARGRLANLPIPLLRYRRWNGQLSHRNAIAQQRETALALLAHHERRAGRPDPTEGLDHVPEGDGLDRLFGSSAASLFVRQWLGRYALRALPRLGDAALPLIRAAMDRDGTCPGTGWAMGRLVRQGEWRLAWKLAMIAKSARYNSVR